MIGQTDVIHTETRGGGKSQRVATISRRQLRSCVGSPRLSRSHFPALRVLRDTLRPVRRSPSQDGRPIHDGDERRERSDRNPSSNEAGSKPRLIIDKRTPGTETSATPRHRSWLTLSKRKSRLVFLFQHFFLIKPASRKRIFVYSFT